MEIDFVEKDEFGIFASVLEGGSVIRKEAYLGCNKGMEVIYVYEEGERAEDRSLWISRGNRNLVRLNTIYYN
ncbi:hypothetical protein DPMN_103649 [Dreissena polymorpha]|uniref:Uncharacterized protein n=1 Tax=Dreissena polymorpha TaxID=45954 RepID=A0A9D4K0D3_DREPO|nr:hypothetical protein DPMN_103649 [Dreissena polymorpha]